MRFSFARLAILRVLPPKPTSSSSIRFASSSRLLTTPLTHPSHGPTYIWTDHARDFTSFILHYLPLVPSSSSLPDVLERRDEAARREGIVSVGHSFSGTSFLLAELEHGRKGGESLGEGLMVVDPMVTLFLLSFPSFFPLKTRLTRKAPPISIPDHRPSLSLLPANWLKAWSSQWANERCGWTT